MSVTPFSSIHKRGFTLQHQQLPWAPPAQTLPLLLVKRSGHIHIKKGSEIPPRRAGVPSYSPVASAAAAAEPAPQDRPRQGLLSVRDILWGVFVFSVAALVLLVLGTLAVGGGQQS